MAPPWSVWWKFNVTSEVLTVRKGQAWPKCCTPVRWCCWVKRACSAKYQLVPAGSCSTWEDDPSPGLFSDAEIPGAEPCQCRTEAGKATLNVWGFPWSLFPSVSRDTAKCHSKGWSLPCSTLTCHQRMALLSCLLLSSDDSEIGRAKKYTWES